MDNDGTPVINSQLAVTPMLTRACTADNAQQPPIDFGVMLHTIKRQLEHVHDKINDTGNKVEMIYSNRIERLD